MLQAELLECLQHKSRKETGGTHDGLLSKMADASVATASVATMPINLI